MNPIKLIIPALSLFLLSCNSTKITSSWKAENAQKNNYSKILVLGIFKDRDIRQKVENQLVNQLRAIGYNVGSALAEYGPKQFEQMKEEEIAGKLKTSGYDVVLTTVLLDKSKEQDYNPGNVSYQPVGYRYNRFGRYFTTVYGRVYEPGYYTTSTQYFLESNLYDLSNSDLKYSVQSKAFDPSSASEFAIDYSKLIVKDLQTKEILHKKTKP